jgi:hypothetical protein
MDRSSVSVASNLQSSWVVARIPSHLAHQDRASYATGHAAERRPPLRQMPTRSRRLPGQASLALNLWRHITVNARRAVVLAVVVGSLLAGTDVRRWR